MTSRGKIFHTPLVDTYLGYDDWQFYSIYMKTLQLLNGSALSMIGKPAEGWAPDCMENAALVWQLQSLQVDAVELPVMAPGVDVHKWSGHYLVPVRYAALSLEPRDGASPNNYGLHCAFCESDPRRVSCWGPQMTGPGRSALLAFPSGTGFPKRLIWLLALLPSSLSHHEIAESYQSTGKAHA